MELRSMCIPGMTILNMATNLLLTSKPDMKGKVMTSTVACQTVYVARYGKPCWQAVEDTCTAVLSGVFRITGKKFSNGRVLELTTSEMDYSELYKLRYGN